MDNYIIVYKTKIYFNNFLEPFLGFLDIPLEMDLGDQLAHYLLLIEMSDHVD